MSSPPVPPQSFWSRVRKGRLVQVLVVYLGASWLVVQVVGDLRDMLELPHWIGPVTLILLTIGFIIILATAWVQSHPLVDAREAADEVPHSWELDLGEAMAAVRRGRVPHLTWTRALVGGVAAFGMLLLAAALFGLIRGDADIFRVNPAQADEAPDGIAVLPFTVRGAALEDWREGMVDLLSTGLDGAGGLRAIASRTVLARWHDAVPAGSAADQQTSLDVARRLGARYALVGSAVAIGPRVRLSVDVHELHATGSRSLGQAQAEGHPDSVLVLVDRLALQTLALVLRQSGSDLPRVDLASVTTSSLPALKDYLEGESRYRQGDFAAALDAYARAVATDTLFALAYWRESQALGWNENIGSVRAAEANEMAVRLQDRLPPRDALLARATLHTRRGELQSLPLLQEAVKKYPDDAEAWYQLGDTYYHLAGALVDWPEIEAAFERAVTLAPRMAPYRIHLLDGAFRYHADSALVRSRVADLKRLAPNSPQTIRMQIAERLIFGDSLSRDSVRAELGTTSNQQLGGSIDAAMSHPRFADLRIGMAREAYARVPAAVRPAVVRSMGWPQIFGRGRLAAGVEALRDPALPPHEWARSTLEMKLGGLPVAAADLERAEQEIDPRGPAAFTAGAYAALRQQWDRQEAVVAHLRGRADSLLSAGDTLGARHPRGEARLLAGYALMQRGQTAAAAREMEAARAETPHELGRWWLGQLHFEAGRWREAEPYFRSFMKWEPDPLAAYYLGQIYQATGRPDQAREMYSFFSEHWAGADAALQPLVADAQQRLARLAPDGS